MDEVRTAVIPEGSLVTSPGRDDESGQFVKVKVSTPKKAHVDAIKYAWERVNPKHPFPITLLVGRSGTDGRSI